ncbi:MAG: cell wall biogenesis protein [Omnitrophica bacterium RIFCSPLOWO2_01_FULL_45_10]|nr:MAG: cell wall biogenesis protein [Omnitrophica bacterium RIFCSPLOWO2_01_FULL_45_10]
MISDAEKEAVSRVLDGDILVHGPKSKEFEAAFSTFTGADFSVSVSSCTAALHLVYFYLRLSAGDEVIVPAQTHTATAHAVELCGARPVFVDAETDTGNIDINKIEQNISARTKAISVVHFLGMPVDMERILHIARRHNLFVVEDCALAIGTYFKGIHAGLHGDAGCFSFYPVKHMTTSEGGMIITRNKEMAERISRQRAFGVDRHAGERTVPGIYDVNMLGFNYRLNELQAAMGIEQVKRVKGFLKIRKENYETLSRHFNGLDDVKFFKSTHDDFESSYYCFSVLLGRRLERKRFEIAQSLTQAGVGTSVYYPRPVPCMSYYKNKYGYRDDSFPVASWISSSSIALPVGPHLNGQDMEYIAASFKEAIRKAI